MTRGDRADVGAPNRLLVWASTGSAVVQSGATAGVVPAGAATQAKVIPASMSLKFVLLKMLYISQRSCSARFSPTGTFLKNAKSELKIDGRRTAFLGIFPMSPRKVGFAKHAR